MSHSCPICRKRVEPVAGEDARRSKYYPFCSNQCKLIDLGAWLDADYRVVSQLKSDVPDLSEDGF